MRRFEKMLYRGAGYTILIMTFFYIFATLAKLESTSMGMGKFFLILAFGMIASFAELVYEIISMKKIFRCLFHYAVLLIAFGVIFITGDFFNITGPSSVFVAITVFTLIYIVFIGIVYLVRLSLSHIDDAIDNRRDRKEKNNEGKKQKSNSYSPRFK